MVNSLSPEDSARMARALDENEGPAAPERAVALTRRARHSGTMSGAEARQIMGHQYGRDAQQAAGDAAFFHEAATHSPARQGDYERLAGQADARARESGRRAEKLLHQR